MPLVPRSTKARVDTRSLQLAPEFGAFPADEGGSLIAGEALDKCAPCYIRASDGRVLMCNATSANEAAVLAGWTAKEYAAGQVVSLLGPGVIMRYGDGALARGSRLYLGATAGRLDSGTTTGDAVGVAQVINGFHIRTTRFI